MVEKLAIKWERSLHVVRLSYRRRTQRYPHELHASFPDALLPSMKGVP